jgi:hypothetical protein
MIDDSITRRAFLGLAAAVGGTTVVVGGWWWRAKSSPRTGAESGLASFFSDPDAARRIGRAYIATHAEDDGAADLAARVVPGRSEPEQWLRRARRDQLARRLANQTTVDFEAGRVVSVAGWELAHSEAALCAFYELTMS